MLCSGVKLQKSILYHAIALTILLLLPGIVIAKQITLSGRLYYGPSDNRVPIRYARVEVWDDWGLAPLASTQTDNEGRFTIRYENSAIGDGFDNRIDPYLKVICTNEGVHVQGPEVFQLIIPGPLNLIPGLIDWNFKTEVIEIGLDRNLTNLVYTVPSDRWPAFASFSAISDVYYRLRSALGTSPTPGRVTVVWPAAGINLATDILQMFRLIEPGDSQTLRAIFLSWEGGSYPHEAQHEYAHALMHINYGTEWLHFHPPMPDDMKDFVEGWAEFITRWARDDDYAKNTLWSSHCESGGQFDTTNVLWDLVDSSQSRDERPDFDDDPINDQSHQSFRKIWTILTQDKPHNLTDFWNAWKRRYPNLEWEAKCCIVNNYTKFATVKNNQPKVSDIKINDKAVQEGDVFSGVLSISALVTDPDQIDIPHLKAYLFVNLPSKNGSKSTWWCLGEDKSLSDGKATFLWDTTRPYKPVYPYASGQGYYGGGGRVEQPSIDFPEIKSQEGMKLRILVTDGMSWDLASTTSFVDSLPFKVDNTISTIVSPPIEASIFNLPRQFSSVQGFNNWYYYIGTPSKPREAVFDNMVSPWGIVNPYNWNGGTGYSGPRYLQITGRDLSDWRNPGPCGWLIPGEGSDVVLGWKADRSGMVYISAMLNTARGDATARSSSDDGVLFSIWKGTQRITDESRVFRGNNESNRIPYVIKKASISVTAGDMIYFYIRRGNWQDCDEMYYSFTISYDQNADLDHPRSTHNINGNTVILSAIDDRSEIASLEYSLHDRNTDTWLPWVKYEAPFVLSPNIDKFMYRAIDTIGNLEPYHIVLVGGR